MLNTITYPLLTNHYTTFSNKSQGKREKEWDLEKSWGKNIMVNLQF